MKKLSFFLISAIVAFNLNAQSDAEFDTPNAWRLAGNDTMQKLEWLADYSPKLKVLKLTIVPNKLWYAEISPKARIKIADDENKLNVEFSWKILAKTPDIFLQSAVRLIDSTGEVFQFPLKGELSSGQWAEIKIHIDKNSKYSSWGGNNNQKLDYPVYLAGIIVDGKKYGVDNAVYYLCDFKIVKK